MPFLSPFMFLLHQVWPSDERIKTLPSSFPVLFLAGEEDELVVPAHMKELFATCSSTAKEWKAFPHGTHSEPPSYQEFFRTATLLTPSLLADDTCIQPGYFHDIALFLSQHTNLPLSASTDPSSQPPSSVVSPPSSVVSGSDVESFELVDTEEGREIKDEGGAGSVNVFEKAVEKL